MGEEATNLVTLTGSEMAPPEVMTEREVQADKLRRRVIDLRNQVAESYFEIGRHLHTIQREALYKLWGFETFSDYVATEVTFKWRKAMYLMSIYRHYALELADPAVFEKVKPLGVSKAAALINVVNAKNVDQWVDKASKLPVRSLEDEARLAKQAREEKRKEREEMARQREATEDEERRMDAELRKGNAVYSKGEQDPEPPPDPVIHKDIDGPGADPVPEEEKGELRRMFQCLLTGDQRENLQAALQCASHLVDESQSTTKKEKNHDAHGYLLDFVATGFLAFHGSTVRENRKKHSKNLRRETLQAIERAFDVRIIAIDKGSPNIVFGDNTVDVLMSEMGVEDEGQSE